MEQFAGCRHMSGEFGLVERGQSLEHIETQVH
jgi:hypothetical protein